jgi:arylsulfatase
MIGMTENVFINVKNRSLTITADVDVKDSDVNGVILAQGGRFGGWVLYVEDGKPIYDYNFLGLQHFIVTSNEALPKGKSSILFDFAYDGGGVGKGGTGTLSINGKKVGEGRIERTQAIAFSADETADVGVDTSTNVSVGYEDGNNRFSGEIVKVAVNVMEIGVRDKEALQKTKREAARKIEEAL